MSRYPKRKRKAASYLEADVDEADDDDDWGPAKEVCIDATSKFVDTIWSRPVLTRKP